MLLVGVKESQNTCEQLLNSLAASYQKKLEDGKYSCAGGYALYKEDIKEMETKYQQTPNIGVKVIYTISIELIYMM